MNDPRFVEGSRQLAQAAIHEGGHDYNKTLDAINLRALARPFTAKEMEVVRRLPDLKAHRCSSRSSAKAGCRQESKHDSSIPARVFAWWTMLAINILNLDEALDK